MEERRAPYRLAPFTYGFDSSQSDGQWKISVYHNGMNPRVGLSRHSRYLHDEHGPCLNVERAEISLKPVGVEIVMTGRIIPVNGAKLAVSSRAIHTEMDNEWDRLSAIQRKDRWDTLPATPATAHGIQADGVARDFPDRVEEMLQAICEAFPYTDVYRQIKEMERIKISETLGLTTREFTRQLDAHPEASPSRCASPPGALPDGIH